jgi:hypothetical protein
MACQLLGWQNALTAAGIQLQLEAVGLIRRTRFVATRYRNMPEIDGYESGQHGSIVICRCIKTSVSSENAASNVCACGERPHPSCCSCHRLRTEC